MVVPPQHLLFLVSCLSLASADNRKEWECKMCKKKISGPGCLSMSNGLACTKHAERGLLTNRSICCEQLWKEAMCLGVSADDCFPWSLAIRIASTDGQRSERFGISTLFYGNETDAHAQLESLRATCGQVPFPSTPALQEMIKFYHGSSCSERKYTPQPVSEASNEVSEEVNNEVKNSTASAPLPGERGDGAEPTAPLVVNITVSSSSVSTADAHSGEEHGDGAFPKFMEPTFLIFVSIAVAVGAALSCVALYLRRSKQGALECVTQQAADIVFLGKPQLSSNKV